MTGGVVKGPVQIDFVAGAGNTQGAGVVAIQGDQERTLSGWA